jgi:hypothetical protein
MTEFSISEKKSAFQVKDCFTLQYPMLSLLLCTTWFARENFKGRKVVCFMVSSTGSDGNFGFWE